MTQPSLANAEGRSWTAYHHWMWFWCCLCHQAYMLLPTARSHHSLYGRFTLWLLGYCGSYAYSSRETFHLCIYFYSSKADQKEAWAQWISPTNPDAGAS